MSKKEDKNKPTSGIPPAKGSPGLPFIQFSSRVTNEVVASIEEVNARLEVLPLGDYDIV